ncbi:MAG: leucine-rich repeat protein, partial [Erysipelotrichaceae bacterium]|nr:leucine-rich repeat protein [Erysipelotrichaceae bacterium]
MYKEEGAYGCVNLKKLDLKAIKTTSVENLLLGGNKGSLEEFVAPKLVKNGDIAPTIGDGFLTSFMSLKSADLTGFSEVTSIGHYFMCNCYSLADINLSGLNSLVKIGNDFLDECAMLKNIDLSSLTSVKSIGEGFMAGCISLESIDLSRMIGLTTYDSEIGDYFLYACQSLKTINMGAIDPSIVAKGQENPDDIYSFRVLIFDKEEFL